MKTRGSAWGRAARWLAALGAASSGCASSEPTISVSVDTDLTVPELIDRVRVDVFDGVEPLRWLDSGDFALDRLPASFAIQPLGKADSVRLRVRGYRQDRVRDYVGERFVPDSLPPKPHVPIPCVDAPELGLDRALLVSGAGSLMAGPVLECDGKKAASELAPARLEIERAGRYRVRIDDFSPPGDSAFRYARSPMLVVTASCDATALPLGCSVATIEQATTRPVELDLELDAGSYVVWVANAARANFEARVLAKEAETPEVRAPEGPGQEARLPRLLIQGADRTPRTEPTPSLAIDRLAWIPLDASDDRSLRLDLLGDCLGVMSDIEGQQTCTGALTHAQPVRMEATLPAHTAPSPTKRGTWPGISFAACDSGGDPELVCVPGGVFTLGDPTIVASGAEATEPERVVTIDSFRMDRHEFTVRRFRALVTQGLFDEDRIPGNITGFAGGNSCAYVPRTADFVAAGREDYPLNCVTAEVAADLCAVVGGRLPSSAEWEYAAARAGKREGETTYPWGDDAPDCSHAILARATSEARGQIDCVALGVGPASTLDPAAERDVTPLGIRGLAGNLSEWSSDSHRPYTHPCWASAQNPRCDDEPAALRTIKGGSWLTDRGFARAARRLGVPPALEDQSVGFRCVYAAAN
jgi:formylglycine-generating enzyme required for sulfatase activity